jgi:hypothetical protein
LSFVSDKYAWCPEGYFVVKLSDPLAHRVVEIYERNTTNREQAERLLRAIREGEDFRSDCDWCRPNFLPLNFSNPADCEAILTYASNTHESSLRAALDESNDALGRRD